MRVVIFCIAMVLCALTLGSQDCVKPEILIYHHVTAKKLAERSHIVIEKDVLEENFVCIASFHRPVKTEEALSFHKGEMVAKGRRRPVLVTFDDGLVSVYEHAFPLAKKYKVNFLVAVLAGDDPEFAGRKKLSWDQMREMQESGYVEFASHTMDHPDLTTLTEEEIRYQLSESKKRITDELGSCDYLVVPYGLSNETVRKVAEEVGYKALFETGRESTAKMEYPYAIKRRNIGSFVDSDPLKHLRR